MENEYGSIEYLYIGIVNCIQMYHNMLSHLNIILSNRTIQVQDITVGVVIQVLISETKKYFSHT